MWVKKLSSSVLLKDTICSPGSLWSNAYNFTGQFPVVFRCSAVWPNWSYAKELLKLCDENRQLWAAVWLLQMRCFFESVKGEVQKRSERIARCHYGSRDEMIVLTKKKQEAELEVSRFLLGVTKIPKATLRYTHFTYFYLKRSDFIDQWEVNVCFGS